MWVYCVVWAWVAFVSQRGILSMSIGDERVQIGSVWPGYIVKDYGPHVSLTMHNIKPKLCVTSVLGQNIYRKHKSLHTSMQSVLLMHQYRFFASSWYLIPTSTVGIDISCLFRCIPTFQNLVEATLRVMFDAHFLLISSSLFIRIVTLAIDQSLRKLCTIWRSLRF